MVRDILKSNWVISILLSFSFFLTGCDARIFKTNLMAKLPDEFQETDGTARILTREAGGEVKDEASLSIHSAPSPSKPLLGAATRLDPAKAIGLPKYKDFLLPQIIISSAGEVPIAVTAKFGGVAEEIRVVVPSGSYYVGLLPNFSMKWLGDNVTGGSVSVDMSVEGRWSRLRADDLFLKTNFTVTPPYLLPESKINPLIVSLVDTRAGKLPSTARVKEGDHVGWAEAMFYELLPLSQGKGVKESESHGGWISLRTVEKAIQDKNPTSLEMAAIWASLALRDSVPAWITFVGNEIFLFIGALPPDSNAFVISPQIFVKNGKGGGFFPFLEDSREAYVDSILNGKVADFLDVRDRLLFRDLPAKKSGGGGSPQPDTKNEEKINPFL